MIRIVIIVNNQRQTFQGLAKKNKNGKNYWITIMITQQRKSFNNYSRKKIEKCRACICFTHHVNFYSESFSLEDILTVKLFINLIWNNALSELYNIYR